MIFQRNPWHLEGRHASRERLLPVKPLPGTYKLELRRTQKHHKVDGAVVGGMEQKGKRETERAQSHGPCLPSWNWQQPAHTKMCLIKCRFFIKGLMSPDLLCLFILFWFFGIWDILGGAQGGCVQGKHPITDAVLSLIVFG